MEEIAKALGPWPVLQLIFGLTILCGGIWAIIRGSQKHEGVAQLEDKRAEWEALQVQRDIKKEVEEQTEVLRRISHQMTSNSDAMKALAAALHNESQWRKGH